MLFASLPVNFAGISRFSFAIITRGGHMGMSEELFIVDVSFDDVAATADKLLGDMSPEPNFLSQTMLGGVSGGLKWKLYRCHEGRLHDGQACVDPLAVAEVTSVMESSGMLATWAGLREGLTLTASGELPTECQHEADVTCRVMKGLQVEAWTVTILMDASAMRMEFVPIPGVWNVAADAMPFKVWASLNVKAVELVVDWSGVLDGDPAEAHVTVWGGMTLVDSIKNDNPVGLRVVSQGFSMPKLKVLDSTAAGIEVPDSIKPTFSSSAWEDGMWLPGIGVHCAEPELSGELDLGKGGSMDLTATARWCLGHHATCQAGKPMAVHGNIQMYVKYDPEKPDDTKVGGSVAVNKITMSTFVGAALGTVIQDEPTLDRVANLTAALLGPGGELGLQDVSGSVELTGGTTPGAQIALKGTTTAPKCDAEKWGDQVLTACLLSLANGYSAEVELSTSGLSVTAGTPEIQVSPILGMESIDLGELGTWTAPDIRIRSSANMGMSVGIGIVWPSIEGDKEDIEGDNEDIRATRKLSTADNNIAQRHKEDLHRKRNSLAAVMAAGQSPATHSDTANQPAPMTTSAAAPTPALITPLAAAGEVTLTTTSDAAGPLAPTTPLTAARTPASNTPSAEHTPSAVVRPPTVLTATKKEDALPKVDLTIKTGMAICIKDSCNADADARPRDFLRFVGSGSLGLDSVTQSASVQVRLEMQGWWWGMSFAGLTRGLALPNQALNFLHMGNAVLSAKIGIDAATIAAGGAASTTGYGAIAAVILAIVRSIEALEIGGSVCIGHICDCARGAAITDTAMADFTKTPDLAHCAAVDSSAADGDGHTQSKDIVLGTSYLKLATSKPWETQLNVEVRQLTLQTLLRSMGYANNGKWLSLMDIAERFVPSSLLDSQSGIYGGNEAACAETGSSKDCNAMVRFALTPIQYGDINISPGLSVSGTIKLDLGEQVLEGSCVMSISISEFFMMAAMQMKPIDLPGLFTICGDKSCEDGATAYMQLGLPPSDAADPALYGAKFCKTGDFFCLEIDGFVRLGPVVRAALLVGSAVVGGAAAGAASLVESFAVVIQAGLDGMKFETSVQLFGQMWTLGFSWTWLLTNTAVWANMQPQSLVQIAEAGVKKAGQMVEDMFKKITQVLGGILEFRERVWDLITNPGDMICFLLDGDLRAACVELVNHVAGILTKPLEPVKKVVDQVIDYITAEIGDLLDVRGQGAASVQLASSEKRFLLSTETRTKPHWHGLTPAVSLLETDKNQVPEGGQCVNEGDFSTGNHCVLLHGELLDDFQAATGQDFGVSGADSAWCICLHLYKSWGKGGGDTSQCSAGALAAPAATQRRAMETADVSALLAAFTAGATNCTTSLAQIEAETVAVEAEAASAEQAAQKAEVEAGTMGDTEVTRADVVLEPGLIHSVWAKPQNLKMDGSADRTNLPAPTGTYLLETQFETQVDAGAGVERVGGVFITPHSGEYKFKLLGGGDAQLHLSQHGPTHAKADIVVSKAGGVSKMIRLEQGEQYYISALGKERQGDMFRLAVAVEFPVNVTHAPAPNKPIPVHWDGSLLLGHVPQVATEGVGVSLSSTQKTFVDETFGWIDDIFSIQEIGFSSEVSLMDGGHIGTGVKYTFGGNKYELNAQVKFGGLNWIGEMASKLLRVAIDFLGPILKAVEEALADLIGKFADFTATLVKAVTDGIEDILGLRECTADGFTPNVGQCKCGDDKFMDLAPRCNDLVFNVGRPYCDNRQCHSSATKEGDIGDFNGDSHRNNGRSVDEAGATTTTTMSAADWAASQLGPASSASSDQASTTSTTTTTTTTTTTLPPAFERAGLQLECTNDLPARIRAAIDGVHATVECKDSIGNGRPNDFRQKKFMKAEEFKPKNWYYKTGRGLIQGWITGYTLTSGKRGRGYYRESKIEDYDKQDPRPDRDPVGCTNAHRPFLPRSPSGPAQRCGGGPCVSFSDPIDPRLLSVTRMVDGVVEQPFGTGLISTSKCPLSDDASGSKSGINSKDWLTQHSMDVWPPPGVLETLAALPCSSAAGICSLQSKQKRDSAEAAAKNEQLRVASSCLGVDVDHMGDRAHLGFEEGVQVVLVPEVTNGPIDITITGLHNPFHHFERKADDVCPGLGTDDPRLPTCPQRKRAPWKGVVENYRFRAGGLVGFVTSAVDVAPVGRWDAVRTTSRLIIVDDTVNKLAGLDPPTFELDIDESYSSLDGGALDKLSPHDEHSTATVRNIAAGSPLLYATYISDYGAEEVEHVLWDILGESSEANGAILANRKLSMDRTRGPGFEPLAAKRVAGLGEARHAAAFNAAVGALRCAAGCTVDIAPITALLRPEGDTAWVSPEWTLGRDSADGAWFGAGGRGNVISTSLCEGVGLPYAGHMEAVPSACFGAAEGLERARGYRMGLGGGVMMLLAENSADTEIDFTVRGFGVDMRSGPKDRDPATRTFGSMTTISWQNSGAVQAEHRLQHLVGYRTSRCAADGGVSLHRLIVIDAWKSPNAKHKWSAMSDDIAVENIGARSPVLYLFYARKPSSIGEARNACLDDEVHEAIFRAAVAAITPCQAGVPSTESAGGNRACPVADLAVQELCYRTVMLPTADTRLARVFATTQEQVAKREQKTGECTALNDGSGLEKLRLTVKAERQNFGQWLTAGGKMPVRVYLNTCRNAPDVAIDVASVDGQCMLLRGLDYDGAMVNPWASTLDVHPGASNPRANPWAAFPATDFDNCATFGAPWFGTNGRALKDGAAAVRGEAIAIDLPPGTYDIYYNGHKEFDASVDFHAAWMCEGGSCEVECTGRDVLAASKPTAECEHPMAGMGAAFADSPTDRCAPGAKYMGDHDIDAPSSTGCTLLQLWCGLESPAGVGFPDLPGPPGKYVAPQYGADNPETFQRAFKRAMHASGLTGTQTDYPDFFLMPIVQEGQNEISGMNEGMGYPEITVEGSVAQFVPVEYQTLVGCLTTKCLLPSVAWTSFPNKYRCDVLSKGLREEMCTATEPRTTHHAQLQ